MAEGKGGKIVIGCCAAVAVVVIAGIAGAMMFAPKLVDRVKVFFKSQEDTAQVIRTWQGELQKAGGDVGSVSPASFAGFTRDGQSTDVAAPGVDFGKTGHLDSYSKDAVMLTVWTCEVNALEAEAMADRLKDQNSNRFSSNSNSSISLGSMSTFSYSGSPPEEAGLLVTVAGRAILLQTNDSDLDLKELLQQFVTEAVGAEGSAAPEVEAEMEAEADAAPEPASAAGTLQP